ncbi:hypothetical protein FPH09_002921 [Escherichia coli]|nr:hypothetical protein [Escherichia coli]
MQRKKLLSVCVAMALSSQTWAADTSIPDSTEKTRKSSKITCPANIHSLSKEQLENLSAECRENKDSAVLPWAAAGLAAVATGIAIYTLSDDDNHHHNNSPVPDDGGDTPVPPDDGGDTPVPPDDGGDTPVPPDDGGDTPVPPDDGGDTPVKHNPVVYKNGVTWDQDAKTVKIRETTFTYSHLQILIKQAVADLHAKGLAVRVVDIAAGHGRYVLDALANEPAVSDILLRDYSELNVAQGQEMIAQRGMSGRVRFEQGDAFNPEELSALTPRPTLAIVSGLYELFPGNEQVKNSLAGLANAIEPGGILLYTGQPWHPQLELIAGVLTSHKDGKPWVMRVRSQGEMDSLVRDAGFDKCTQRIDEWGIFTVSMAVRRDN